MLSVSGNLIGWHLASVRLGPYSAAMRTEHSLGRIVIVALAVMLAAGNVVRADNGSTQKLPGVTGDYRIAKPAPQPEPDDALPAGQNGQFKIGNTDVRISGTITIDVGTGNLRPPAH